jgi:hypothetical protein
MLIQSSYDRVASARHSDRDGAEIVVLPKLDDASDEFLSLHIEWISRTLCRGRSKGAKWGNNFEHANIRDIKYFSDRSSRNRELK